jgi:hypothetical protein
MNKRFSLFGFCVAPFQFAKNTIAVKRIALFVAGTLWCVWTAGCQMDSYTLESGANGNLDIPDAARDDGGPQIDAAPDACIPTDEICDGIDNNCNGETDESFDLQNDPSNCGECGRTCEYAHAFGECSDGQCAMGDCLPGFHDVNEDPADGCEYGCLPTNNGTETCDAIDNDCNGETDETFDLENDPLNCGQCHRVCVFFKGVGGCTDGECVLVSCRSGYVDKDENPNNGCECFINATEDASGIHCDPADPVDCEVDEVCVDGDLDGTPHCSPIPADACDGVDNDCDAETDEDAPIGDACYTHPTGCTYDATNQAWSCEGQCAVGFFGCVGGVEGCTQQQGPTDELCDSADNDCDGLTDENYDLQNDPSNCGSCGHQCTQALIPNAVPGCAQGGCIVVACLPGYYDINDNPNDGCEYPCALSNGGVEACGDSTDNDCDGETDEGFDFTTDPANCGDCGYACAAHVPPGALATGCDGSVCQFACLPGYHDIDGDLAAGDAGTGCEYSCAVTNNGVEICDDVDNDCNGTVDDGFDKEGDPAHCGTCGYACGDHIPDGATVDGCLNGQCVYTCLDGNRDLDGDLAQGGLGTGCEYACPVWPTTNESCNDADDDCDGLTDRDANGVILTQSCYTGPGGTAGTGICQQGTQSCSGGGWGTCEGEVTPEPNEQCDTLDHDCDGDPLNGFNLDTDLLNCGGCGNSCFASAPPDAHPISCTTGACDWACNDGYQNPDGDWSNGCEYHYDCEPTAPDGVEYCDGADNDCDGSTDENADLVAPPVGYCRTTPSTPCENTTYECRDGVLGVTWYCIYPPAVETDPSNPNLVLGTETLCDGLDGNCDGFVDLGFDPPVGTPCDDGGQGICRGTGTFECRADHSGTECVIDAPGQSASAETCDNEDNDCDGLTDETAAAPGPDPSYVVEDMIHVDWDGHDFWIYTFEASRPDATTDDAGAVETRACSRADVLPWASVTYDQATAACAAVGMRLCTAAEWEAACIGVAHYVYPYGDVYQPTYCNGRDLDGIPGGDDDNVRLPTGDSLLLADCYSDEGIYDLSGNLREWTDDQRGQTTDGTPIYVVRGGGYTTPEGGLQCTFDMSQAVADVLLPTIGFRCCSDTAP